MCSTYTHHLRVLQTLSSSLQPIEIPLSETELGVVINYFSNCYYLEEIETEPKTFSFHKLEAEI